jgi:hypothetical protein
VIVGSLMGRCWMFQLEVVIGANRDRIYRWRSPGISEASNLSEGGANEY